MSACLAPPTSPLGTVRRPRLHSALDAAIDRRLTVVAAPAGWGKTVVLSTWSAECGAGWVSIGPEHADPSRLRRDVDAVLSEPDDRPPAIVLDDVHLLGAPGIEAVRALVRDASTPIVVSSRADPDLGLPRLRLEGRLAELRGADLAFDEDELVALLDELGLELGARRRCQLLRRTDGWAAGIRLVAVALLATGEPERLLDEFTGDDRVVADYLTDEVLATQPHDIREFLLRTCIVDELDVDLAAGLADRDDAAAVLARLERDGLFVVALDGRRRRYRYHALFAELLRARLRAEHRSVVPELHARAADWFAAQGSPDLAVRHALAAASHPKARALLAEHWLDVMACGYSAATDDESDPRLAVAAAHERLAAGDRAGAIDRLAVVDGEGGWVTELATLLRAYANCDVAGARQAAAALARRERAPDAHDEAGRALSLQLVGATEFAAGDVEVAGDRLEEATALAAPPGRERLRMDCVGRVAVLEVLRGRLTRAQSHAHAALELARGHGWEHSLAAGWAQAALAAVAWLRDDLATAERRADDAAAAAYADGDAGLGDALRALRAHLHAARGDEQTARTLLRIVRDATPGDHGVLPRWLDALGPAPWAPASTDRPAEVVARAMGRLRADDPGGAVRLVMPIAGTRRHHPTVRLSGLLVEAMARDALHEPGAAAALERALEIADAEGVRRPFLDGGAPLRRVLQRHACRRNSSAPLLAGILDALPAAVDDVGGRGPAEPLSERERAVLRLMPTILANTEIAGELFVSVNTVKTHLRSIYRKLDVGSRREAVAKARELELL